MNLADKLIDHVRACSSGIWVTSQEYDDGIAELATMCASEDWRLAVWDVAKGFQVLGQGESDITATDPLAAISAINTLASPGTSALLVLKNFHSFIRSPEIIETLAQQIARGKKNRSFIIVMSPVVDIPIELSRHFVLVDHDLPSREQIEQIARGIATEEGELPEGGELEEVLDSAAGLTRFEAEGAFSLSLVREGKVRPQAVWELKSQAISKSGLLKLHKGGKNDSFDQLGGLEALKDFCRRVLRRRSERNPLKRPRGVLLLGVPGTGKSAFCKALGNETGRITITLDIGSLLGSLVGQSEGNLREALKIIEASEPAICFVDEIDKALAGASSGQGDSGVGARMFGTLLSWLSDHQSDVFFCASANSIGHLPHELTRSGRFDGIFFIDTPGDQQKEQIWDICLDAFDLDRDQERPATAEWTGAEIRSCCRLSALLDVPLLESAKNVVPVATTAAESVEKLRTWASGRVLNADAPGIYSRPRKSRRSVVRDPSLN